MTLNSNNAPLQQQRCQHGRHSTADVDEHLCCFLGDRFLLDPSDGLNSCSALDTNKFNDFLLYNSNEGCSPVQLEVEGTILPGSQGEKNDSDTNHQKCSNFNLQPLDAQVGGHTKLLVLATKVDGDGDDFVDDSVICKPLVVDNDNNGELIFYQKLQSMRQRSSDLKNKDASLLLEFVPRFKGILTVVKNKEIGQTVRLNKLEENTVLGVCPKEIIKSIIDGSAEDFSLGPFTTVKQRKFFIKMINC